MQLRHALTGLIHQPCGARRRRGDSHGEFGTFVSRRLSVAEPCGEWLSRLFRVNLDSKRQIWHAPASRWVEKGCR